MVEWKIINIVFTIKFNTNFPIERIASTLTNNGILVDYEPESFPALIITLENSKKGKSRKITVFKSGIINVYGLKKIDELNNVLDEIKKTFSKCGIDLPNNYEIKLSNIVVAGNFDYTNIDIVKMYYDFDNAEYDPERFPAVSIPYYLSKDYKVTFNIFKEGYFVCAGIRTNSEDIYQAIDNIVKSFQENIIKRYIK